MVWDQFALHFTSCPAIEGIELTCTDDLAFCVSCCARVEDLHMGQKAQHVKKTRAQFAKQGLYIGA